MPRPRTPTARKVLAGNPGKRRLTPNEPRPPAATSAPPSELPAAARAIWDALAPDLVAVGCLATVDRGELAKACRYEALCLALLTTAEASVAKDGGRNQSGALWAALKAGERASSIFGRFGVTPAERSRLSVTLTSDDDTDPIEQLREKRRLRLIGA